MRVVGLLAAAAFGCSPLTIHAEETPDWSPYTRPQRLVEVVPGRRMNLVCAGTGSPTVVFESGMAEPTGTWALVQPVIARVTRACSYDRDAVGFKVEQTFENNGQVAGAIIAAGDCRIVLNQDDGKLGWDRIKGQGFYLQINVAGAGDVDAAAARIAAAGGTLLDQPADRPWGARMFQFKDLDGFKLGVSTPLAS